MSCNLARIAHIINVQCPFSISIGILLSYIFELTPQLLFVSFHEVFWSFLSFNKNCDLQLWLFQFIDNRMMCLIFTCLGYLKMILSFIFQHLN